MDSGTRLMPGVRFEVSTVRKPAVASRTVLSIAVATAALTFCKSSVASPADAFNRFGKTYCFTCHGPDMQKGKLRLDTLTWSPGDADNLEIWYEIADRLETGDMPPADADKLPGDVYRARIMQAIRNAISVSARPQTATPTTLRRLNTTQYRNTLRDLLKLDVTIDPTRNFPADGNFEGFDTVSDQLATSSFLLKEYLQAADAAIQQATWTGSKPAPKRDNFAGRNAPEPHFDLFSPDHVRLVNNLDKGRSAPFELEISVELLNKCDNREFLKRHPYDPNVDAILGLYLYYVPGGRKKTDSTYIHHSSHFVPANQKTTIKETLWLSSDWQPALRFENAPRGFRWTRSAKYVPGLKDALNKVKKIKPRKRGRKFGNEFVTQLDIPKIRVHEASLAGPIFEHWPPASHRRLYRGSTNKEIVHNFARQAFRRPVPPGELEPFVVLAGNSDEGLQRALRAILIAPQFTTFYENEGSLDSYAIANRLSYFLWNSMPDDELLKLAATDALQDSAVLRAQVERLLRDDRATSFVETFVWQWLHLKNTQDMPPGNQFRSFHKFNVADDMIKESTAFFQHLLDRNLPVSNLIRSDFAMLNASMARHYGIPGVIHHEFRPIALRPADRHRGGLLGQTAVLTASANGVETSPVVRGIWVLENLLGTPPAPPPDDVEIPDPDIRGALTVREILAKHRNVESCNTCHRSIDPIGFALENYDPVGVWRETYPPRTKGAEELPVDATGTYGGQRFKDVNGLKTLLLDKQQLIKRNLARKLLICATGRDMGVADRSAIDAIVQKMDASNGGLRDLVKLVVTSKPFLTK